MEEKVKEFIKLQNQQQICDTKKREVLKYIRDNEKQYEYALYAHQEISLVDLLLRKKAKGILAFDPGCGKTLPGCLAMAYLNKTKGLRGIFIVPSNMQQHWQEELLRWTGQFAVIIDKIRDISAMEAPQFFITTNNIFCKLTGLDGKKYAYLVDEAHSLKNDGQLSKKIQKELIKSGEAVILVTATLIMNRAEEAFNYLHILYPKIFNNRKEFTAFFCDGHMNAWGKWESRGILNVELFAELLNTIMLKAKKEVVLSFLPPKERVRLTFDNQDESLARLIEDYRDFCKSAWEKGYKTPQESTEIMKMAKELNIETGKSKCRQALPLLLKIIAEHPKEKIYIWTINLEVAQYVHENIPGSILLTGDNKVSVRKSTMKSMKEETNQQQVLIMTIDSCGTGMNGVGATLVIFLQLKEGWSSNVQAEDRCHRIGCTKTIKYIWLLCRGTYDDRIIRLITGKKQLIDVLVDRKEIKDKTGLSICDSDFFDDADDITHLLDKCALTTKRIRHNLKEQEEDEQYALEDTFPLDEDCIQE